MAVNPSDWLDSKNAAGTRARQKGDPLEYATVIAALRAGVRQVARGVRLSIALPDSAGSQLHAELDVVFTYRGRLWVIEVKDRKEVEGARALIKEKIVAAWEVGGDLGRFVYVSRTVPGPDLLAFAKSLGVAIVPKGNLRNGMSQLLKEQPRPHLP
ncbi:MAG: hypothetical protein NTW21_36825 [Verrucomicrobia bacterium]|nr:hypothetical protein [Verrucomicrobiota bacterium]